MCFDKSYLQEPSEKGNVVGPFLQGRVEEGQSTFDPRGITTVGFVLFVQFYMDRQSVSVVQVMFTYQTARIRAYTIFCMSSSMSRAG